MGRDGKKTQSFYSSLFGWQIDTNNPMEYGMVQPQDGRGTGGGVGAAPDGKPFVTFYVEVDDPQKYLDKAVSMGAKVTTPVTKMEDVTFAHFTDPDGNLIRIAKMG